MKKKPVQIAFMVIGPLVLIAGLWFYFGRSENPVAGRLTFFDVVTGERFTTSRTDRRVRIVPAPNEAGERTIFPISRDQQGEWIIDPHYHDALVSRFGEDERVRVDLETFRLLTDR